mmetsp:Transcript_9693/g.20980  ORF Transcript_9693/g.20980 Transcript_9693/m.20980 type:complete len:629 (+) Transcript_9693:373-2259(+)|eukprot:CAMPEP_0168184746 /NCGR_PEP_ID=MMETSP0139_2-20121125/13414_1 /TAXON_ID=44445 /ORGANISM="Pseudo-nitzschia australis, Strain 10249 10 AB" /LENGTH=628 /DNA_ID=CAMNT_0008106409 /DNA_START=265 /DNA_END=2151 /DNA_ORIENTATION=+
MNSERQQQDCDDNQVSVENENIPHTIYKKTNSSKESNIEQDQTMTSHQHLNGQSSNTDEMQKLKLIVRSQYWGRILKGRTCRNVFTNMNVKAPRVISSQAVLYNEDGFWGCCPTHGKRVLELQEYHFSDVCEDCNWNLFLVGTWVSPSQSIHDFFLLPENQSSVDIKRNVHYNGWSFVGTCSANIIRSGIDAMLRNLLQENNSYGHRYHHAHIDIMMDQAFDRETPRSRKLNNEKIRAERKISINSTLKDCEKQESSVSTDGTASTEQALTEQDGPQSTTSEASNQNNQFGTKPVGAPPIPRLINNDSSMVSGSYPVPVPHSMPNPATAYQDAGWTGEATYWNHNLGTVSTVSGSMNVQSGPTSNDSDNQEMYWQPGKNISLPRGLDLTAHQYPYWQPIPQPVPHPPYMVPDMHMLHHHPSLVHARMQHMHHQHQPMGAEMQQYVESLQLHPHYHHNPPPFTHSDVGMETAITATNNYQCHCADQYEESCTNGSNSTSEVTSKILPQSLTNATARDNLGFPSSSPSTIECSQPESRLTDTAGVSPIAVTAIPTEPPVVENAGSGMSPPSSSSPTLMNTVVTASPVNESAATNTAKAIEFDGVLTPRVVASNANDERGLRVKDTILPKE